MKKFIFILILCLFFINLASAGVVDVTDPVIMVTNWSDSIGEFYIQNAITSNVTFTLKNAIINNYYYLKYDNGTDIVHELATSQILNLTASNLPDGTYYITNSNPRLLITTYNATNKILSVSNMSDHIVTLNLTNVTNGRKYTLYNNANVYITSGYAQDDLAVLVAQNLYDGVYHINTEIIRDTILVNKDNLLTKQLNVSYIPEYNGQLVHLAYNVNESYVFIDMKSTSSLANITSNATHLIITDTVSDVSETVYYNVTAIRKSTITYDAIYITTTIIIGGIVVLTYRKRRPGR